MLKQISRLFLIQTLSVLPGFSQSKLFGGFLPAMTIRSGATYSVGKHENAKVSPGLAFGFNFDLQKKIKPAIHVGASFRYDFAEQHIEARSIYSKLSYNRILHFISYGGILSWSPAEKKTQANFSFGFRSPLAGRMVQINNLVEGQNGSLSQVNLKPYRKFIPFIQVGGFYNVFSYKSTKFYAGALAGFSLASTDFKYQSSTINSFELCVKITQ